MLRITLLYASGLIAFVLLVDWGALPEVPLYVNRLPFLDKVIHFAMFGCLALMANVSLAQSPRWSLVGAIATGSILVVIASTVEECTNLLVECRTWSLADLAANYLGILCVGILPLLGWQRLQSAGRLAD